MKNITCFHEHLINACLVSKKIPLLLFTILLTIPFLNAQVSLVKDIGTTNFPGTDPKQLIAYNGNLLFSAGPDQNNFTLWLSDGTDSGTVSIKDLGNPFQKPGDFYYSSQLNLVLFKSYPSNPGGTSVWITDGTETGTEKLSNTFTFIDNFYEFNNEVYFQGGSSLTLAKTDGSTSGTVIVGNSILAPSSFATLNDNLLFSGLINTFNSQNELISSDGTESGSFIVKDINPGFPGSFPDELILYNNKIYFSANTNLNGRELWVTDGTNSGTVMVDDLNTGSASSNPTNLILFDNELYFTADDGISGVELYKMDTNETITQVFDINIGANSSNPSNLTIYNNRLYYSADDGLNGIEPWVTYNGAIIDRALNTVILKDINTSPSSPDSNPIGFTEYFGELYFAADDGVNGIELWKTNGADLGTVLVDDINPTGDSNPQGLTVANNRLFFAANDGTTGIELWKYQDPTLTLNEFDNHEFALFPNPTTDSFTIKSNDVINSVSIFDVQGKTVKSFSNGLVTYSISDLNSGLYFVRIKSSKGGTTKKLLKQ
ncbi:ELWxxDGT repeat protein [Psychroserpens sp.]|uniref:ELWxxDGT repeat protein n=1 Tax=Psychroserpens sp. TaxID=2020870 RepID=UPI002B27B788|nr:ELWxxDGT repeat protein [Psychroserpens sp.]